MQPGERELHLRLDARDPGDATLRGPLGDVLQQRRLAHPRLAAQDLHRALPRADALQLAVQCLALDCVALVARRVEPIRRGVRCRLGNRPRRLGT